MGDTIRELRNVLGIAPDVALIRVIAAAMKTEPDEVALTSRSLLGVLKFLSHSVEPPFVHVQQGRIPMTVTPEGEFFEWREVTGELLRVPNRSVPSSRFPPTDSASTRCSRPFRRSRAPILHGFRG